MQLGNYRARGGGCGGGGACVAQSSICGFEGCAFSVWPTAADSFDYIMRKTDYHKCARFNETLIDHLQINHPMYLPFPTLLSSFTALPSSSCPQTSSCSPYSLEKPCTLAN